MDPKIPLLPRTESQVPLSSRQRFRLAHAAAFACLVCLLWLGWSYQESNGAHKEETKVPFEIHIMSKCPSTRDCLKEIILPTMQNVSEKVDFKTSFIGTPTNHDDGVECKHGQTECLGNILELCAASVYPDPKLFLGFMMCLSRDYEQIPAKDFVEDCALEHGMDFDKLNHCMSQDDGAYGMGMLRESVERSAANNATHSCTIRLNNETRCIMEGGKTRECEGGGKPEDFIKDINKLYKANRWWWN